MATPLCPKCGSPDLWDETTSKFWNNGIDAKTGKPKPRWKCKDKNCGGKIFEPSGASAGGAQTSAATGVGQQAASEVTAPVTAPAPTNGKKEKRSVIYLAQTAWVLDKIVPMYVAAGIPVLANDVHAMVAVLFIADTRSG